ncbi:MAG TPA: HDOD domain-containing protein [Burkholderiales bacterium]|nr:HDOD domain-containing protein [Burkholderiales bacterium]
MSAIAVRKIGRFEIERELGSGARGGVYLARDTRADRPVVLKTIALKGRKAEQRAQVERVLAEFRTVTRLSHPNIVPLVDAGEDAGAPYLVFDFVHGEVLSDLLQDGRQIPVGRALDITIQILKALGFAHQKEVLHGDLKPGNILLTHDDTAVVMDFGTAQCMAAAGEGFTASPAYTAPECAGGAAGTPRADLYSVAMILYHMLTGRTAVAGTDAAEVLRQIASGSITAPSRINDKIDERLDDLLLKALSRDPEARFDSPARMEDALYLYLNPEPENSGAGESDGTLGFLLRRMRHKSDFPALSATISAINRASASDEGADTLSTSILKDFALTSKLLKMVNTAYFGNFSGTISTVSRAVVIMGFDRIRNAAITLMLFEHLQNKAHAARLKDDLVASYFSGILARQLVPKAGIRIAEEGFICATFHNLGRLLTSFYFPEEGREIEKLISQKHIDEAQASVQVLGVSFDDLGIGVAKAWNFPSRLVQSMRHIKEATIERPQNEDEKLRALAELSAGVCDAMRNGDLEQREKTISGLVLKFGDALGVSALSLSATIKQSAAELAKEAIALNLKNENSAFLTSTATAGDKAAAAETNDELAILLDETALGGATASGERTPENPQRKTLLFDGIEAVTTQLMGDYKLNDVMRTILSTMYRSMGFTRVLLYTRDSATNSLKSRFGLGQDVDKIVDGNFSISLAETKDVFQAALARGADVFIENVDAEAIRKHVPVAYRDAIPAKCFALFPIIVRGKAVGLLYADSDLEASMKFTPDELSLLKTLRNQAVIAIKAV